MITWDENESVPADTCVNPAALPVDDGALQLAGTVRRTSPFTSPSAGAV